MVTVGARVLNSFNPQPIGKKICEQIARHFKQTRQTRYWIAIAYYSPDDCYNLFFNSRRPHHWQRSWPIAILNDLEFDELIAVLNVIRQQYHFTFEYSGFNHLELDRLQHEVKRWQLTFPIKTAILITI